LALHGLLLRHGQAGQRGLLRVDELAQRGLVVRQLPLQAGDPGLGPRHLLLHPGQLAGVGEQLLGLRAPVPGQLHQQRPLLQQHGRVTRGQHPRDRGRPVSSNAAAAVAATLACAVWNWVLAFFSRT
jgi:hypothetical protein